MKPVWTVKIEGFEKAKLSPEALKRAAMAGGQVIEAQAKINVESTFSDKSTGNLAGSIKTVPTKSTATSAEVAVGSGLVYARIQELGGWVKSVHAKALHFWIDGVEFFKKAVYIPARPWLRPAADTSHDRILKAIAEVLKRELGAK